MSSEEVFASIEDFISRLKKLGITKIAFSQANERRVEQTAENQIEVIVYRKVDLLAYRDSVLYKYSERPEDLDPLYERLVDEGFEVKRINKNIT